MAFREDEPWDLPRVAAYSRRLWGEGLPTWERARLADLVDVGNANVYATVRSGLDEEGVKDLPPLEAIDRPWEEGGEGAESARRGEANAAPPPPQEPISFETDPQAFRDFFGVGAVTYVQE